MDNLSDTDFSPQDTNLAARREASLEALKLYSGSFASLCTPMDRFIASTPTQDVQPWLARHVSNDSAIARRDCWETLDATQLASELNANVEMDEVQEVCPGSPRPSSDTLSVTRSLGSRNDGKEHGGARNRRKLRVRRQRRNTVEKHKMSKSPHV
ncbi:hypothetical protein CC80DRAFT_496694 [Byssothecium circinans]|uniref:Uncharacterized protein n=1 Tax=Byssothecium circinans TaxID=147558 RepID=A0A6A5TCW7_9PLEO|nr:hypothetical protein CC80DRAFT_496694 [Byssothecium circinans]